MNSIDLEFIQAQLKLISGFQKNDIGKVNKLLNGKTKQELEELKDSHFKDDSSLKKYLKRTPQKDFNDYCVAPVNLLRYRIFQELEKGNKVDIKSFFDSFEPKFLSKQIVINDLPKDIQNLYIKNGWGSSNDPYHNWRDYRKVAYDYVISPNNYNRLIAELEKISEKFKQRLSFKNCIVNKKGPWGSQNNSFDDFCWIAWCPDGTMKKTVHLGLRLHPDHFLATLYVGDDFYKDKNLKNQSLREKEFYNLEEALDWLFSLEKICLRLNADQKTVVGEFDEINDENTNVAKNSYTPKRTGSKDSLGLHTGSHKPKEPRTIDIDSSHLYLFKVEGISFDSEKFKGTGVFKIGMSISPDRRKKDIVKGFGLSSLLIIKELFVKKKKAKYETQLKDFIDGSSDYYYDGEFFCTELSDEVVKKTLEKELRRIEKSEVK